MLLENASLKPYNTFGVDARARFLARVEDEAELRTLLGSVTARNLPLLVLGGGSNLVVRGDVEGLVLVMRLKGIRLVASSGDERIVEAAAGEVWHDFVRTCLANGWNGLENLSLIPGTVGAAPVQNVGAYGVEIKDRFHSLTAIHRQTGEVREFRAADCAFAYRDSLFKQPGQEAWIITRVRFRLSAAPALKLDYGDIRQQLAVRGVAQPTPRDVSDAVCAIRRAKLPDPALIGNAGSFFKNPVVPQTVANELAARYPGMPAYPQAQGVKLAAGWLIEQAGWKGRSLGQAGVYEKQALVLVNRGGARGADILALADAIRHDVRQKFGVGLEMEPVVIG